MSSIDGAATISAAASSVLAAGEAIALVLVTGDEGGVDLTGARLRKVDSRREEVVVLLVGDAMALFGTVKVVDVVEMVCVCSGDGLMTVTTT